MQIQGAALAALNSKALKSAAAFWRSAAARQLPLSRFDLPVKLSRRMDRLAQRIGAKFNLSRVQARSLLFEVVLLRALDGGKIAGEPVGS